MNKKQDILDDQEFLYRNYRARKREVLWQHAGISTGEDVDSRKSAPHGGTIVKKIEY